MSESKPADLPELNVTASHNVRTWKHTSPLLGCCFDPSGRYLFASSFDFTIQRWDLEQDQHTAFTGHESWLRGLGFSSDGQTLYSAGYEGKLCFWDATAESTEEPLRPQKQIEAHEGWIRWLAVHPDGKWIATAGNDLKVKLWSSESGELVQTFEGHQKHIYSLLFHPEGKILLSGDLGGVVNQWDLESGSLMRSFDAKLLHTYHGGQQVDYGGVRCMALSTDGKLLACGGLHKATNPFAGVQEPLVVVFDWQSGEQVRTHEATEIPRGIVWRLFFAPDGTLISGIGGQEAHLAFWREEKTDFHKLTLPDALLDLDRHPNGIDLASVHHSGEIRISRMAEKA